MSVSACSTPETRVIPASTVTIDPCTLTPPAVTRTALPPAVISVGASPEAGPAGATCSTGPAGAWSVVVAGAWAVALAGDWVVAVVGAWAVALAGAWVVAVVGAWAVVAVSDTERGSSSLSTRPPRARWTKAFPWCCCICRTVAWRSERVSRLAGSASTEWTAAGSGRRFAAVLSRIGSAALRDSDPPVCCSSGMCWVAFMVPHSRPSRAARDL